MAADLAVSPSSGIEVLSCGDAHLSNFGFFATPERRLVFDINDADEGGWAPWEWDLKRLVTSVILVAQHHGASDDEAWLAARRTSKAYRKSLRELAAMTSVQRFYAGVDADTAQKALRRRAEHEHRARRAAAGRAHEGLVAAADKARRRTSERALRTLAVHEVSGNIRLVDQPPLTRHTERMDVDLARTLFASYLATAAPDVAYLLSEFEVVDVVLRVVGVGSVGTRCFIALLQDADGTTMLLQFKEATASVLASHGGIDQAVPEDGDANHGRRVVTAQRVLQTHSDAFLGWMRGPSDPASGGAEVDYYWRQFRDMKGSIDLSSLDLATLTLTARACAALLARAHSQSRAAVTLAPTIRGRRDLDEAFADAGLDYARRTVADHAALVDAVREGRLEATTGL